MTQTPRAAERMLPQNIEAECGLLGSIIIDPEALSLVADFLRAEDFYRDAHRTIYEVMLHLYNQRTSADFITICDVLESREKLEEVGGASYITSLINQVPTSGNVLYYARIVERTATLRNLIRAAGQIAALAYDAEDDATPIVERAEQLIFAISQRSLSLGTDASLAELLTSYMARLDQLSQQRGSVVGVPTGFADLDRLTGGLRGSDLIVLAAQTFTWKNFDGPEPGLQCGVTLWAAHWYLQPGDEPAAINGAARLHRNRHQPAAFEYRQS